MTTQNTETTQSRSFTQSFDARLLSWGAIGIAALIVAAFMSLATPRASPATTCAPNYDAAGSSRWPMS